MHIVSAYLFSSASASERKAEALVFLQESHGEPIIESTIRDAIDGSLSHAWNMEKRNPPAALHGRGR
jgi:hypothetical protein